MRIAIKLTLAFLLVTIIGIGISSVASIYVLSASFDLYIQNRYSYRTEQLANYILENYRQDYSWRLIQSALDVQEDQEGFFIDTGNGLRRFNLEKIIIADVDGRVVGDSTGKYLGLYLDDTTLSRGIPLISEGRQVGTLIAAQGYGELEQEYIKSITKASLTAGLLATVISLIIGLLFSRRMCYPLVALVQAAQRFAKKELSYRIKIESNDEIGQVAHSFNQMAAELEQNEEMRKHMIADVAHEIRTPLSILRGNFELLQEGAIEPSGEVLASLHDETVRMSRLVADLQDLALAEAGELRVVRSPVALAAIVDKVATALSLEALARGVNLVVKPIDQSIVVDVDFHRIEQALYNLLINALKHTLADGRVTLSAVANNGFAQVSVEDTGQGISPADLPFVFDRFYRAAKSRNRESGMGLGLAIAKSFIEIHGGKIWVESTLKKGSVFTFSLPCSNSYFQNINER